MKTKWILRFALALVVNGLAGGVTSAQTQHINGGSALSNIRSRGLLLPDRIRGRRTITRVARRVEVNVSGQISRVTPQRLAPCLKNKSPHSQAANAWPVSGTVNSAQCGGAGAIAPKMVMKQTPTQCAVW